MSPMLKALLAVKERGYNPPGAPPMERLALISEAERRLLKRLGGAGRLTKSGIPSFYMEGSKSGKVGDSKPSQSKTSTSSTSNSKTSTGSGSTSHASADNRASSPSSGNSRTSTGSGSTSHASADNRASSSTSNSRTSSGNVSTSHASVASRASPISSRTSDGLGRGISTPTASGSPNNNPASINARNSMQDLRNKAIQGAANNRIASNTANLMAQHLQYRSPNDFPYAGAEDLTRDEFNRTVAGADIRPQNFGFQAPPSRPRSITGQVPSGQYLTDRLAGDVEDLRRPDLANPDMNTGDWTYNPVTGVRTPVYNGLAPGAIPTPRINPLKQSPVMSTPRGDVPLWNPTSNYISPTTPDGQAMERAMQIGAFNTGTLVQPFSGTRNKKKGGTINHPSGNAIDVNIINPATGKALGNFQDPKSFPTYESYAMSVRKQQEAMYGKKPTLAPGVTRGFNDPNLTDKLRWGGYFSNKGSPFGGMAVDQMHFDVTPGARGQMKLGSWAGGANPVLAKSYKGFGPNQPPSSYELAMNNPGGQVLAAGDMPPSKPTLLGAAKKGYGAVKSFLAPQAPIPIPRQKPMIPSTVAPATGIPTPRMKPMIPSTVAPATRIPVPRQKPAQTQVAYSEPTIVPAGGPSPFKYNGSPYRPRGVMKNGELIRDGLSVTPEQLIKPKAPAPPASSWSNMLGFDKLKTTYNNVNENVLKPIAQGVETYGQDATQRYVNAKIAAARKKGQPTRYAQYGNMNRRRRQPITMGNA